MNKHTPGPWMYRSQANGSLDFFGEGGNRVILQNVRLINQEANARLIAAAPSLLEALESALELIDVITPLEGDVHRKARAAIAKATGEQP
jgi:hypothetical protein